MNSSNPKPIPKLSKKEIITLEEEWRLKLKVSGFNDVESTDYRTKNKFKRLCFIKGRIRFGKYGGLEAFKRRRSEVFEYYRIIGLYAHHSPPGSPRLEKYRELLKELALTGSPSKAIRNLNSTVKYITLWNFVNDLFPQMLEFVKDLEEETLND